MSAVASSIPHLHQEALSPNDREIIKGLETWLVHASFDPTTNICTDAEIGEKSEKGKTLAKMDLFKKVEASTTPSKH